MQSVVLLVLLAATFPGTFFRGEMIAPGDILFQSLPWSRYAPEGWERPENRALSDVLTAFHPYYAVTRAAFEQGELPLWNPFELAGLPLLANYQTAVFYPPRLLHVFLDVPLATTLFILLKLWLCGMTAYACARGLGLRSYSARFVSVAWMLATYNVIWSSWSLTDVSAWLPVLFLGVERTLDGRYRQGFFVTTLGATLMLLAGHPETAFTMSLGLGLYVLLRLGLERRRGRGLWLPAAASLGAWAVALLVCAVQLLPFIEYLANSATFFDRPAESNVRWLPASVCAAFWAPWFFGSSSDNNYWGEKHLVLYIPMVYSGIAAWLGAALCLAKSQWRRGARTRVLCLFIASLLCVPLAFDAPPFDWINRLPVFSSNVECYYIGFVLFALPLLGAIGLDRWVSRRRKLRQLAWLAPVVLLAGTQILAVLKFNGGYMRALGVTDYVHRQVAIAALFAALGMVVLAIQCITRRPRWVAGGLTLVLACDLLYSGRTCAPTIAAEQLFPETELTRFLEGLEQPCRIDAGTAGIASGLMAPYGIEEWLGYDGLYPERIITFQTRLGPDIWNAAKPLCATQYYLYDPRYEADFPLDAPGRFKHVTHLDGLDVYEDVEALPRAFLVGGIRTVRDAEEMFDAMASPGFEPKAEALVLASEAPERTATPSVTGGLGNATVTQRSTTHVTVGVDALRDCVLVLADGYYPGWRAEIDGAPAEIFPAYYAFRGVVMPAGQHQVEFTYDPASYRVGLWISIVSTALSALAALYFGFFRKQVSVAQ